MQNPVYENKNNGPERKPWSIKSFPVKLRRKFAASVVEQGTTIPDKLEEIVTEHLKTKKK